MKSLLLPPIKNIIILLQNKFQTYSHIYIYILEPQPKNTAPALTFACLSVPEDTIILVTPSDHLIINESKYQENVNQAKKLAEQGYLMPLA